MTVATILAYLTLLVAAPLLAYAAFRLWVLVRRFRNPVTRVQAIGVTVVLVHAIVFGLIFLQNDLDSPPVDLGATRLITRGIEFVGGLIVALAVLWLFPRPGRKL